MRQWQSALACACRSGLTDLLYGADPLDLLVLERWPDSYLSQITRFTVSSSFISSRTDGWIQSAREAIRSMHLEKGRVSFNPQVIGYLPIHFV